MHNDATGERAYAVVEDWDAGTTQTVVIGGGEMVQVDGSATPSPSGSRLLVHEPDPTHSGSGEWAVVDLDAGTSAAVPLPPDLGEQWVRLGWAGSDDELLITAQPVSDELVAPTSLWLLAIG